MTETDMDLSGLLAKQDGGDFLRGVAEAVPRPIVEADGEGLIGPARASAGEMWRKVAEAGGTDGYRRTSRASLYDLCDLSKAASEKAAFNRPNRAS